MSALAAEVESLKSGQEQILALLQGMSKSSSNSAAATAGASLPPHLRKETQGLTQPNVKGLSAVLGSAPETRAARAGLKRERKAGGVGLDGDGIGKEGVWDEAVGVIMEEVAKTKPTMGSAATRATLAEASKEDPQLLKILEQFGWREDCFVRIPAWNQLLQTVLRSLRAGAVVGGRSGSVGAEPSLESLAPETGAIVRALTQQTQALQLLMQPKDSLSKILGGGDSAETGGAPSGAKGALARLHLRKEFQSHPEKVYQSVEANMA